MIKKFKDFLLEFYDSPDIPKIFSKEDLRKAAFADDPYSGEFRKFQYGLWTGSKSSAELNRLLGDVQWSIDSMFGVADYLYQELIKNVPEFKDFKFNKDEDTWGNLKEGKIGFHLKKEEKLPETRFNAESEIWIYFHIRGNQIFDYKKGKIYVLFVSGLRPTEKSWSPASTSKSEEDSKARDAFSDLVKSSSKCSDCNDDVELDDKKFDNFMHKLNDILYGHPDNEDKALFDRLKISHKNLSLPTFIKTLTKVRSNFNHFKTYLLNKYDLKF